MTAFLVKLWLVVASMSVTNGDPVCQQRERAQRALPVPRQGERGRRAWYRSLVMSVCAFAADGHFVHDSGVLHEQLLAGLGSAAQRH